MDKEKIVQLEKEISILDSKRNAIIGELREAVGCRVCDIKRFDGDSLEIHIAEGIQRLADKLHEPLYCTSWESYSGDYPYKYYFIHEGIRYFQLDSRLLNGVTVEVREE